MVQQQLGQLDGWLLAPAFPHESPIPFATAASNHGTSSDGSTCRSTHSTTSTASSGTTRFTATATAEGCSPAPTASCGDVNTSSGT
ncbi:hypothetical protein ES703_81806 [subsurface metagenome]